MQQSRSLLGMLPKHVHKGMAGSVLNMQHPVMTVRSLKGGGQTSVAVPIKIHPQSEEPVDALRCLFDKKSNGIPIAKASTGVNGVLGVACAVVVSTRYRSDATLSPSA